MKHTSGDQVYGHLGCGTRVLEEPATFTFRTEGLLGKTWFLKDAGIHQQNYLASMSELTQ
jgi:hypothetical protein